MACSRGRNVLHMSLMYNKIMKRLFLYSLIVSAMSCQSDNKKNDKAIQLITLDPGHFHAALVQKTMYADVDSVVHVYAPDAIDLKWHLDRIETYNTRSESPTHWNEEVYRGNDFFEKMIQEKKGKCCCLIRE